MFSLGCNHLSGKALSRIADFCHCPEAVCVPHPPHGTVTDRGGDTLVLTLYICTHVYFTAFWLLIHLLGCSLSNGIKLSFLNIVGLRRNLSDKCNHLTFNPSNKDQMLLRVLMGVSFCACLQWLKCQVSVCPAGSTALGSAGIVPWLREFTQ